MANTYATTALKLSADSDTYVNTLPFGNYSTQSTVNVIEVNVGHLSLENGAAMILKIDGNIKHNENVQLNASSTGATDIYYNGNKLAANYLQPWHIYTLVYSDTASKTGWHILSGGGSDSVKVYDTEIGTDPVSVLRVYLDSNDILHIKTEHATEQ